MLSTSHSPLPPTKTPRPSRHHSHRRRHAIKRPLTTPPSEDATPIKRPLPHEVFAPIKRPRLTSPTPAPSNHPPPVCLWICLFWTLPIDEALLCVAFCGWLLLLNIVTFSRFTHGAAVSSISQLIAHGSVWILSASGHLQSNRQHL